ncbi:hypothetical protein T484DRAFT_1820739 [Baffinella frigidus]|nr:hypothetical protein T484DRAFT_1820739 [Cryptophyta sp. CCMP2293]
MGDRALLLVLVLHLAAVAGAMPHSSMSRRLAEVSSPAVEELEPLAEELKLEGSTKRRRLDGAPIGGATECPCLELGSPKLSDARAAFLQTGLPAGYGEGGCKAHSVGIEQDGLGTERGDAKRIPSGSSKMGDALRQPVGTHCENQWCYVDATLCVEDAGT